MQDPLTEGFGGNEVTRIATEFGEAVALLMVQRPIFGNAYFKSLRDGSMDKAGFQRSQAQFFFAVRYFARAMAALAARLPDSRARMALARNLAEEHGGVQPAEAHDNTFKRFMASLGVPAESMDATKESPEVRAFNHALLGTCTMAEPELAFACLGIIEYTFAGISSEIGRVVTQRGWVDGDKLVHYTLHSELDRQHAREFFAEVEPGWSAGGGRRRAIEDGLSLGLYLFDRLYADLSGIAAQPS